MYSVFCILDHDTYAGGAIYGCVQTSGPMTNATNGKAIITFTHINQRKNVKYDATPEPKCDSISLMRNSHVPYDWMYVCRVRLKTSTMFLLAMLAAQFEPLLTLVKTMERY
uniref:Uncharacterized protein n=1 Tax=Glossina palpalis gambiensis TaxID=67801 RepID=A0A1B0C3W4_9MUSC